MNRLPFAVLGLSVFAAVAPAAPIDWSAVTLDGTNPYTFTDTTLGLVTITYSGNYKDDGIITLFGSRELLGLGENPGTGSGTVTLTWEHALTSLDLNLWDLDLSEYDLIHVGTDVSLELIAPNPLGGANALDGNRLNGSGADLPNGAANNFATVRLTGAGFTEFAVEFQRPGSSGGGHAIGFGDFVPVPAPASVSLLAGLALAGSRRRR